MHAANSGVEPRLFIHEIVKYENIGFSVS